MILRMRLRLPPVLPVGVVCALSSVTRCRSSRTVSALDVLDASNEFSSRFSRITFKICESFLSLHLHTL